jgi:hypothetical protein
MALFYVLSKAFWKWEFLGAKGALVWAQSFVDCFNMHLQFKNLYSWKSETFALGTINVLEEINGF